MPAFFRQWPGWVRVTLAGAAMLFVFIQRPVFVDDHAHYAEALGLAREGSGLYRGSAYAMGWESGGAPGEANPPAYFYIVSQWIKHVGPEIWKAHLLLMGISLAGLLGFYALAKRYTPYPEWAALLWMSSPHFWLTSNSLLLDAMLGPVMVLGLACWIKAWESRQTVFFVVAALLLALAPFVKYTGLVIWPVVLLWTLLEGRPLRSWRWLWLLIPPLCFLGWMAWSHQAYGQTHFSAVARDKMTWPTQAHVIILFAFAVGTTPALLLSAAAWFTGKPRPRLFMTVLAISLSIAATHTLGLSGVKGVALGLWCGTFLIWSVSDGLPSWRRSHSSLFLHAWSGLGLLALLLAIPWVCARYLVIVGPALILVTVQALEKSKPEWLKSGSWRAAALAILLGWGALMAHADYAQARTDQAAARWAEAYRQSHAAAKPAFYAAAHLGGAGYYLEASGWKGLKSKEAFPKGSYLFIPRRSLPRVFWPEIGNPELVAQWSPTGLNPLRTLDGVSGAGFYGSIWAPLPFSFSKDPLDHYLLLESPAS